MKNLLLAAALLATASTVRADDGDLFALPANWEPAELNAPAGGAAFIDPVFPEEADKLAVKTSVGPESDEGVYSVIDVDGEELRDGVIEKTVASVDDLPLP